MKHHSTLRIIIDHDPYLYPLLSDEFLAFTIICPRRWSDAYILVENLVALEEGDVIGSLAIRLIPQRA